jgi:DNA mismatch repair protein MSH6
MALHNSSFVPNDVSIGGQDPSLLLLTGANMGGKSTIMRQVCINTILGQIGCYCAAEEAEFTLVDRIFTRIGANDKLELGKSTFYVEMEDMHLMSKYGTEDSLCIVDELGRGTDALEGTAIASSFMEMLSNLRSRTIFTSHFHMLFRFARDDPNIDYYKMKIYLDEYGDINFLYKLERGVTESSFGIQVAKIAGIKDDILTNAEAMSLKFDRGMVGVFEETDKLWKNIVEEFNIDLTSKA